MNPFTRYLASRSSDQRLKDFIVRWDSLEALIIRVYRGGESTSDDEAEYVALKQWLETHYPEWQAKLAPHWRETKAAGKAVTSDPFLTLLAPQQAGAFVGNWAAMQQLPAARETLNRYISNNTVQ